jgi:predicted DNA-binding transcriptional regulator AlpA
VAIVHVVSAALQRHYAPMSANTVNFQLQLLSEVEAAKLLCLSRACLRHWRTVGAGPPWKRIGERLIRYDLAELRRWISEQAGVQNEHSAGQ